VVKRLSNTHGAVSNRYPSFGASQPSSQDDVFRRQGLLGSLIGHVVLAILMFTNFGSGWGAFEQPVVYSVTIEGGKKLGGISQVPEKDQKAPLAPPKKTSSEEKAVEEPKPEPKVEPKKDEPKIPEAETGEIQIKKKVETKKEEPKPVKKEPAKKAVDPKEEANKRYQEAMQRYLGESSNAGAGNQFGAAALGGNGMGGGVVRPPEFFAYMKKLEQYIKSGWIWSDNTASLVTQVVFEMAPDGRISGITITKGSGNRNYDDSVYRAVLKASPAPPPPASVYEFFRSVRMTFDPRE
jgi:TonB family protein